MRYTGAKKDGRCVIKDDFHGVIERVLSASAIILASPIFFYSVTGITKAFMDRCQSLWVKKYWIHKKPFGSRDFSRRGMFISVGATKGKRLFDGALLTVRYFFDALDTELSDTLLIRGLDFEKDVLKCPQFLTQAEGAGRSFAQGI